MAWMTPAQFKADTEFRKQNAQMTAQGYTLATAATPIPAGATVTTGSFTGSGYQTNPKNGGVNTTAVNQWSWFKANTPAAAAPTAAAPAAPAAPQAEVKGGTSGTSGADKPFNISDYEAPKKSEDEGYLDKYLANKNTDYDKFLESEKSKGDTPATGNPQEEWKKYATDWGYSDIARRWDSDDRSSLTTDPQGNTVPRRASNTMAGGVDYVASLSGFGKYQRPYT